MVIILYSKVSKNVEIDGKSVPPPRKIKLNSHNINSVQSAILEAYKGVKSDANPFMALNGHYGRFYSIMHDGIQKFSMELNGVFIRALFSKTEDISVVNIPWSLTKIPGGSLNTEKLINHLFKTIKSVYPLSENEKASTNFYQLLADERGVSITDAPQLPIYFDCCMLESVDWDLGVVHLNFKNWPVSITADGCQVNVAAGKKLSEEYGLLSPTTCCAVHAADGSIKRMVKSKTMCVDEVKTFARNIRILLNHLHLSGKSTALLKEAMHNLDMKPVHLVTWCPTRMMHLLIACRQTVENLVPICNVLVSADIKREERASIMSPKFMIMLHLLSDLEVVFGKELLRPLDCDDALIIEAYTLTMCFVEKQESNVKTPQLDRFMEGLKVDQFGNIIAVLSVPSGDRHEITLNYNHRKRRDHSHSSELDTLKSMATDLKQKVLKNLIENTMDQAQGGTIVEYASMFDFNCSIDLDKRIEFLEELHSIYGMEYVHSLPFSDQTQIHNVGITRVDIKYTPKLQCSKEVIVQEFKSVWPQFNRIWPKYRADKKKGCRDFFYHILSTYEIGYPNLCELIVILLAFSPSTGPLERSYSKLGKICYKDRNRLSDINIETLYLLAVLQINDKDIFPRIRELLESN